MAGKSRRGRALDEDRSADRNETLEEPENAPSRTERKTASEAMQRMGEELVALRAERVAALSLPAKLTEAIAEARRLKSFGARRRQAQFIGKLMRRLDEPTLAAVREIVEAAHGQSQADKRLMHRIERWRERLLADDAEIKHWLDEFPGTDGQRLRALIRQARKDAEPSRSGEPSRHGRAFRELFALLRDHLVRRDASTRDD